MIYLLPILRKQGIAFSLQRYTKWKVKIRNSKEKKKERKKERKKEKNKKNNVKTS